jgi:hypothetical protein
MRVDLEAVERRLAIRAAVASASPETAKRMLAAAVGAGAVLKVPTRLVVVPCANA